MGPDMALMYEEAGRGTTMSLTVKGRVRGVVRVTDMILIDIRAGGELV